MANVTSSRLAAKPPRAAERVELAIPAPRSGGRRPERQPKLPSLDRLIHERLRLGIIAALAVNDRLTFADLKDILEITDGNLSDHARKLENAGYVRVEKTFQGRKPQTAYLLTPRGRQALRGYLESMQGFLQAMNGA